MQLHRTIKIILIQRRSTIWLESPETRWCSSHQVILWQMGNRNRRVKASNSLCPIQGPSLHQHLLRAMLESTCWDILQTDLAEQLSILSICVLNQVPQLRLQLLNRQTGLLSLIKQIMEAVHQFHSHAGQFKEDELIQPTTEQLTWGEPASLSKVQPATCSASPLTPVTCLLVQTPRAS